MRRFALCTLIAALVAGTSSGPSAAGTLEVIINNPPFPTTVPNYATRLLAIDHRTGAIVADRTMPGIFQAASLTDANEAAYSLAEVGSQIFTPKFKLQVQRFDQPAPNTMLTGEGPMYNLGVTDKRVVWQAFDGIHVLNRDDGTQQQFGGSSAYNVQISRGAIAWQTFNVSSTYQYHVNYMNLDTGSSFPYYFWERPVSSLAMPRRGHPLLATSSLLAASNGQLYRDAGWSTSGGSRIEVQTAAGLPLNVSSPKTNGNQILFRGATPMLADGSSVESGLYLLDGGQPLQLASSDQLNATPGTYALSGNVVAWQEGSGASTVIKLRDLTTGAVQSLPGFGAGLQLWDVNDQYILLSTSAAVPEPPASALGAVLALSAAGFRRRFVA